VDGARTSPRRVEMMMISSMSSEGRKRSEARKWNMRRQLWTKNRRERGDESGEKQLEPGGRARFINATRIAAGAESGQDVHFSGVI
jgi:hypothetical protein